MAHELRVGGIRVDARDVAAWFGIAWTGTADSDWRVRGEQYVADHPRSARTGDAQRLALLRRLAAGPATRLELLAAMRGAAGYVGANDFENRLRDLRATDTRAEGRAGIDIEDDGERWWLCEPFPSLEQPDRRALGFAKSMVEQLDGPMALRASSALERMLPGVTGTAEQHSVSKYPASPADLERFHEALAERRPIRIRYYSLNRDAEGTYNVVPVQYVTVGATVKAICVVVDEYATIERELQFALDRLTSVDPLPDWRRPSAKALRLERSPIVLQVTSELYRVMRDRNLFDIAADVTATQHAEDDSWRVTGSFPVALAWDVMEQLCAWAGNAQVLQPYWLVNAVIRRLNAGLRVMAEGAAFEVVKPEPQRPFSSLGEAVAAEHPLPAPTAPRKILPRR